MRIGLIDVDSHNFPNLALMRISAYHKSNGDVVEWWMPDKWYDIVYKSKVFSETYSVDAPDPINCDRLIRGGTGYQIRTINGREVYGTQPDNLPTEIEQMFPDYSIYPQYEYAVSLTSRGCPRGCTFCIVGKKEGLKARKVANVSDFWNGQKEIKILDPNITACSERIELLNQYAETGAWCDFTQGVDARLLTDDVINAFNAIKIKRLHFAWDRMKDSKQVLNGLALYAQHGQILDSRRRIVYVLTNYDTTMEENLYRIYKLRELGYDPDIRVYDKPNAPREIKRLQRWVNNRVIFKSCARFEDYKG